MKKSLSQPNASENETLVTIDHLGAQGDGAVRLEGRTLHIPLSLPGEKVWVREEAGGRARLVHIEEASPDRTEPICRYFGSCGGCALQHYSESSTAEWKTGLIKSELGRVGLDVEIAPIKSYPLAARRRATFSAEKDQHGQLRLGFKGLRSHDVVDIETCPIVKPEIAGVLPALREALKAALPRKAQARIHITAADNGLDIGIEGPDLPREGEQAALKRLDAADILRVIWNKQMLRIVSAPMVSIGGARVPLPQGAFLQAVAACEVDMAAFAVEALKEAGALKNPICDLFAGLGAFSFPLARFAPVTAVDMVGTAIDALQAATRANQGLKPIQALRRDLYRAPFSPLELNRFGAAVLDPPREGAEAQCRALAASLVPAVVMLSCNPATFARDAALLVAGGYRLERVAAFDQFKFSAHVELGALFQKPLAGRLKRGKGRTSVRPPS